MDDNWHTGTPTEEGWYLVKYRCVLEGKYFGKIEYHTMHIFTNEIGMKEYRGTASDDVWLAFEYQNIDEANPHWMEASKENI